jgi:hypothetical protein
MLRCIFLWLWEACQRCDFDYSKYWFLLVMKEVYFFGKDRLVMPLDMAIKMLNLKLTNVYDTYYFFFYQLLHCNCFFYI